MSLSFPSVPQSAFLLVLALLAIVHALTPSHYLSQADVERLKDALEQPLSDLETAYYYIVGFNHLGASVADEQVRLWNVSQ